MPFAPAQIHQAFARGDLLAQWWGPEGFRNSFEVFEFKLGGRWKFVMHGPDGTDYPNENVFLKTQPDCVVIQHLSQPHFTLTVTLTALGKPGEGGERTRLNWHQAFDDPQVAAKIWHIIVPANEQNLDRLHQVLLAQAR